MSVTRCRRSSGCRRKTCGSAASDGSKLHAWFLPAQGRVKGTVLHLHGNAANVSNHLPLVAWLPPRGFNVLTLDYRGFGRSQGTPSLDGVVDDAAAALNSPAHSQRRRCHSPHHRRAEPRRRDGAAAARARREGCAARSHRFRVRQLPPDRARGGVDVWHPRTAGAARHEGVSGPGKGSDHRRCARCMCR